jgi:outer membrane protein OmpA-like peptidoglycan-associated protein
MRKAPFRRLPGGERVVLLLLTVIFLLAPAGSGSLGAQTRPGEGEDGVDPETAPRLFRFGYREDERYRIVGVNRQQLFVDGRRLGDAEILTRIQLAFSEVSDNGEGDSATVRAVYRVSEDAQTEDEPFSVDREYSVSLRQDSRGVQTVPSGSFVPQVRDVPSFPDEAVRPGGTWSAPAFEVYDFREGLGIPLPVVVPVTVNYRYEGVREFEGREYDAIRIEYVLFHRPDPSRPEAEHIRLMTARFAQDLLWNPRAGRAHYYEETYNLFIQTTDGSRLEYRGEADGRVEGAPELDRDEVQRSIEDSIVRDAIGDTTVRSDEEGVTISFEDIRFAPDSADLEPSETPKLEWLARVLADYPDRDVLVSGHTALAGTPEGRQRLSEERARAVVDWLIANGVRDRSELMYRGFGARRPVAGNDTEEERRRNRRVEITILEN